MEVSNMASDSISAIGGSSQAASASSVQRADYSSSSVQSASASREVGAVDKASSSKSAEKSSEIDTKDSTQISKEAKEDEEGSKTSEGKGSFIDNIVDTIKDAINGITGEDKIGEDKKAEEEKEKTPEEKIEDLKKEDEELQKEEELKEKELKQKEKEVEELKKQEEQLVKELEQAVKDGDEEKIQELQQKLGDINGQIQDKMEDIKDLKEELGKIKEQRADNNKQQNEIQQQIQAAQQAAQQQAAQQAQQAGGDGGQQQQQVAPAQQAGGNNGGGAAPAGGCNGGGGAAPAGGANGANGANGVDGTNAANGPASANIKLTADDQKVADFINNYLEEKDSPAAGQGAGEMMVKYGKEYDVDPLVLLSIAGQETNYGKAGIGVNGMLGVGAYDNDPNNATRNPAFSGVEMQIKRGAETFARLREKGGSSSDASIADQTAAVNKAGWATDQNWHNGVTQIYNQIANKAVDAGIAERVGGGAAELAKQFEGQTTYNIQGLDHLDKSIGYDLNCANFVSACLQNTGGLEGHYNNCTGLEAALQKQGYVQVSPDQAQPGDVWFNPQRGHTELVKEAGNPPVLIGSNNGGDNIQEVTTDRYSGRSGVFYHRN